MTRVEPLPGANRSIVKTGRATLPSNHSNESWTITWGDVAMNEVHMQRIGDEAEQGVSAERLREIKAELEVRGMLCYLIDLRQLLPMRESAPEAAVLVVKGGVGPLTEDPHGEAKLLTEQRSMPIDYKAYDPRNGGVFDKRNRGNNLLGDYDQAADYADKQGTVVDCFHYPVTSKLRAALTSLLGANNPLVGETNHYFDASACGIGWHGDRERKMVAGVRLGPGATGMPLKFLWFLDSKPVGAEGRLLLDAGDVYFMSEKAVGFDWLTKKELTLRHAAGADKYSSVGTLKSVKEGTVRRPPVVQLYPLVATTTQSPVVVATGVQNCVHPDDGYGFASKVMQRCGVAGLYFAARSDAIASALPEQESGSLPLLYLEGEDGGATKLFVNLGISVHMLHPVNLDSAVTARVEVTHPGVKGHVGDIEDMISVASDNAYYVIWLDYMCRFDTRKHRRVFQHALRVAPFVSVTFSVRATDKSVVTSEITSIVKTIGGKMVENVTPYKGRSDIETMIKFTVTRKNTGNGGDMVGAEPAHPQLYRANFPSTPPLDGDDHQFDVGSKVFVYYRGITLTANVLRVSTEQIVLVKFDYDAQERWVPCTKVQLNRETMHCSFFEGQLVGVPITLFRNLDGYETTKRTMKRLLFSVGKPDKNKQLKVYAVMKDHTIYSTSEKWTISVEQAACWHMNKS